MFPNRNRLEAGTGFNSHPIVGKSLRAKVAMNALETGAAPGSVTLSLEW